MIGISDALGEIRKSSSVPIIVCAVPPTKKTQHHKLIGLVKFFLKYQCEKFPTAMLFLIPGLKISDIQDDGIHLKINAKRNVCDMITAAAVGFCKIGNNKSM